MKRVIAFTALALATGLAFAQAQPTGERAERAAQWRAEAEARFAQADKDGDGKLDKVEARDMERISRHFDRLDANADGKLDKDELRQAHRKHRGGRRMAQGHEAFLRGLWVGMDDDKDGLVSRAELGDKAPKLAENFEAIDANRDGKLSRGEMTDFRDRKRAERRAQAGG